jgi:hypothetical protein
MPLTEAGLDSFGQLSRAIGLTTASGTNTAWFSDPMGGSSNGHGLRDVLSDDAQREALLSFVDGILGPPDGRAEGTQRWVPLFHEGSPNVTISAVVEALPGAVRVGVGLEHTTGTTAPCVTTTVHVPIVHVPAGGADSRPVGGTTPRWLLVGRPGGRVDVTVAATFEDGAPSPGEAFLRGANATIGIPTSAADGLAFRLDLVDLQLPGATAPTTRSLVADGSSDLGTDVFEFVTGLLRAQLDTLDLSGPALRVTGGLAGMFGLRDVPDLPALPLADLPAQGVSVLVGWIEQVLASDPARDAWLGQLAQLVRGTPLPARDAVSKTIGGAHITGGLRVSPGTGGHSVLVPWVEVSYGTRSAVEAALAVDLMRIDTGTGSVQAVPAASVEAVFGADAGGADLLAGIPHVGSVHTGVALDPHGQPAFTLTLHDVDVVGGAHHDVLDLSTPQAALDAAESIVDEALAQALAHLGQAGGLLAAMLGVTPPAGVAAISAAALVTDPLGAVRGYWNDLIADATAMASVLGSLRALLTSAVAAPVDGAGTAAAPWTVDLVAGVDLLVWRADTHLLVALSAGVSTPVLAGLTAGLSARLVLLDADLDAGHVSLVSTAVGRLSLAPGGADPARLDLGAAYLEVTALAAEVVWGPRRGLTLAFDAAGTHLVVPNPAGDLRIGLPLPAIAADGSVTFAPDWTDVETLLATLLARAGSPVIDLVLDVLGWRGAGARLQLAGLVTDPATALATWAAALALDCWHLRAALGPVAVLLSGGNLTGPLGQGQPALPYRCPVAGNPQAPGLTAWTVPGCQPVALSAISGVGQHLDRLESDEPPDMSEVVTTLQFAATSVAGLADKLVSRTHLGDGLEALVTRWAGTDGVTGPALTLPSGVTSSVLDGLSYAELVAAVRTGSGVLDGLASATDAVVHVGVEATWDRGVPAGSYLDASAGPAASTVPATASGTWFLRVPDAAAGVQLQADRLSAALADRTAGLVVVGYGPAGAAVLRAAADAPQVTAVVTVGTPWSAVSLAGTQTGLGADAVRLLASLVPADLQTWPDDVMALECSPVQRGAALASRAAALIDPAGLPSAGAETIRPGLELLTVSGAVVDDDVRAAIAALVAQGIRSMIPAEAPPPQPVQELHLGVDVPVLDVELGGVLVGLGGALDLLRLSRHAPMPTLETVRSVIATLRLGVADGWLVGGPGAAQHDLETRWMEVRVTVPLDGTAGDAELVLHDATAFTATRERWLVRADGADGSTTALPEIKVLLGEVVARLGTAAPDVVALLQSLGLIRAGGLDPDSLDRLLFDPAATLRGAVAAAPAEVAAAIRVLLGEAPPAPGSPSRTDLTVTVGAARVTVDLAAATLTAGAAVSAGGMPPVDLTITASPAGVAGTASFGAVDPAAGGLALAATFGTGGAHVDLRTRVPGATADQAIALFPAADLAGIGDLLTRVVPAALAQALATVCRDRATGAGRAALDAGLDALGLLTAPAPGQLQRVVLPVGLLADPGAWFRVRSDPAGAAVALLDALAQVAAPARGASPGWPLADILTVNYAVAGGRLELVADLHLTATVDGRDVVVDLAGGLRIGLSAAGVSPPQAVFDAAATVDGRGLRLRIAPTLTLELLLPPPASPIQLYPGGAGIGNALVSAAESILPTVLDALAGHRSDAGSSLLKDVGAAVFELGTGLDLLDAGHFTTPKARTFAADPGAALVARLPALVTAGLDALARALDPAASVVAVSTPGLNQTRFAFGAGGRVHVTFDGSTGTPAVVIGGSLPLGDPVVAQLIVDGIRLTPTGVHADIRLGPALIPVGAATLRPLVSISAGSGQSTNARLLSLGVALDDLGAESVELRWTLDARPPVMYAVTRTGVTETPVSDPATVALRLVGVAVQLASGLLAEKLKTVLPDRAVEMLQDVVFTAGDVTVDPAFVIDLLDPDALLRRLERLAWNAATASPPLGLTLDSTVSIALAAEDIGGGQKHLGLSVSLVPGKSFVLAQGETEVSLEVDASWIDPAVPAGLTVLVLKGPVAALDFVPGISIAGIGMRFRKPAGPLLDLGAVSIDAIAFHLYGEATAAGVGGGARIRLDGLAVAPGGGGSNGVANALMNDAGKSASPASRPSFSPSLAVQKHPATEVAVALRAGDPPGPWWVVIQRQLGPLYVDRIGLDTVESGGQVTQISLLFTGSVSLFGLSASVDRLGVTWTGGDVLSISSWSVDLMGLAVSADLAGLSLSGGLLKFEEPQQPGVISYVGMLSAHFGTYGLSLFGGYSDDEGNASFFVFGAINGPIGGPPAFFVTGIGGGLGINRALIVPTDISKFADYPFIKALDPAAKPSANPMDDLRALAGYFPPQIGNFWFAAGISFTCFALVDGIAVLAVSIGDGLEVDLLGLARMALPRPEAALVSIELALLARFSTEDGLFLIKAQLTDNSWLLYSDVRLTGGFAFATWWKGALAGQFVLTIGGYHPSFHRDGYPDVPRLGLTWKISDEICVKGESYFALTSEALMAGVDIEVSADFGWAWARLAFGAHGIVYFDPFWFEVLAYVRISAGITIDLGWFGTISMSISLGAQIKVWGPDFAGEATFEVGPCSLTVPFGSEHKVAPETLTWQKFVAKYLEDAGDGSARALSSIAGKGSLPAATGGSTSAPSADGSPERPFQVFAEFELTFVTTVPAAAFDVGLARLVTVPVARSDGSATTLGLPPMGAGQLGSTLVLRLDRLSGSSYVPEPRLSKLAENLLAANPDPALARLASGSFPLGAWGQPLPLDLPVKPIPTGDIVNAGTTITLVSGIDSQTEGPPIDYYRVEAGRRPLPLQATGTSRANFLQVSASLPVITPTSADEALAIAATSLFGEPAATVAGILDRGRRSEVSRAAYAGERVAPPLFGTLTDGLAKSNGADGERSRLDPVPPAKGRAARAPYVTGLLTSGAGAPPRAAATTVASKVVKRRLAPTVDSVRGRLGVQLPITLTRAAAPVHSDGTTVVASAPAPFTDVAGVARSSAGGRVGAPVLGGLVSGLGAAVPAPAPARSGPGPRRAGRGIPSGSRAAPPDGAAGQALRCGDLVVLHLPDAAIDVDPEHRPTLQVTGRARVTMLSGRGIGYDADLNDAGIPVPAGTDVVAVHADVSAAAPDGLPGWHSRSRIGRIGTHAAVGAGCAIIVDGVGGSSVLAWGAAAEVVSAAARITTRFTIPVTTVAIALAGDQPTSLDPTSLQLLGARVATDNTGAELAPTVVSLGPVSVLVYPVVPEPGAVAAQVAVSPGSAWALAGVFGSEDGVAETAELLAQRGLTGVGARLLATAGPGVQIAWEAVP